MRQHLVLLGDSIFDNGAYVDGAPAVIDQVRSLLPDHWRASLLAVDGNVVLDVRNQIKRLPLDASHLVMSIGGNDALGVLTQLHSPEPLSIMQSLKVLAGIQMKFEQDYVAILNLALMSELPLLCCTIYDQVPGLTQELRTALSLFNDVISRECARIHIPVLDLRSVCTEASDYSVISPIEPSKNGGGKIASRIVSIVTGEAFESKQCRIYA
jgi:hypothetical protein